MKALKYIFLILLALIVVASIYLATLDGKYDVKRSRIIKANPEVVFDNINDYKNWQEWGPWYEEDPSIKVTYADNTVGEGGSYSWTSKDGDGTMNTLKVEKPKRIEQEIIFKTPFGDMKSDVYWNFDKADKGTNVTWGMKGEMGFFTRWMAKGMEEQIGPMEERGLELLDEVIQKEVRAYSIESNGVVDYGGGYYLYTTTSCKIDEIEHKFPTMLMKVGKFVRENDVRTTGGPFSLYHKFDQDNGTAMFSVCYPIPEKMITPKDTDIVSGFMKSGIYYKTTLKGSYENSEEAWIKAMEAVKNLEGYTELENGEPFEIYVNSPMTTANPADLISEIYIPVEKQMLIEE